MVTDRPTILLGDAVDGLIWAHYCCQVILLIITNGPAVSPKSCCQCPSMGPLLLPKMLPMAMGEPIVSPKQCYQMSYTGSLLLPKNAADDHEWAHGKGISSISQEKQWAHSLRLAVLFLQQQWAYPGVWQQFVVAKISTSETISRIFCEKQQACPRPSVVFFSNINRPIQGHWQHIS